MADGVEPGVRRHRLEKVGDDEQKGAAGHVGAALGEERKGPQHVVLGRVERRLGGARRHDPRPVAPARRQPPRLAGAVVERRDVGACDRRARGDRDRRLAQRPAFREPWKRRRVEAHRGTPVEQDRDAWRLVRRTVADDELVAAARRREPRRREPVDRRDRVARLVLA